MNIRTITPQDIYKIKQVHQQFFSDEFDFPNFFDKFLNVFVVENDKEEFILAAGVRTITESVAITDMSKSVRQRREALYKALHASLYTCGRLGYDELHAFVQDEIWKSHLEHAGFESTKGQSLVIGV
jgi:DNA-binding phage protein